MPESEITAISVVPPPISTTMLPLGSVMGKPAPRSEEHTSELQSRENLVCRLLLEKKKHWHDHSPGNQQHHQQCGFEPYYDHRHHDAELRDPEILFRPPATLT